MIELYKDFPSNKAKQQLDTNEIYGSVEDNKPYYLILATLLPLAIIAGIILLNVEEYKY